MPAETGYSRQTQPRPGAAMPGESAASYGAGLGRVLEDVGNDAHRRNLRGYQIERERTADAEWSRFQHDFAVAREETGAATREARQTAGDGHAARMGEAWQQRQGAMLEGITDERVRRRAQGAAEEWGLRYRTTEADFEEVKRSERIVRDTIATQDISANRIRRLENPQDYLSELELGHDAIAGLNVADDVKEKLGRDWDKVAGVSFLRGVIERDPRLAREMLASDQGLFDHLDPDVVDQLLAGADVEIRRQDAAVEHAGNVARADFRERVRIVQNDAGAGVDVGEQLPGLITEAQQLGLADVANELQGLAANTAFAKVYESATPVQRERRVAELEAKGDKRSELEDRELHWLEDKQGALDSRFNSDPAGFYARTSTPPPPLDFTDPASIAARSRWSRAASEAAGRPVPPLTMNEARAIGATWSTGRRADQVQVMDALAALPADQAAAAARMVDGNDPALGVMVTLPRDYRQLALDGRDRIKAEPKILKFDKVDDEETVAEYDRRFGEALRAVPPAQRQAILRVAGNIVAGSIDQSGGEISPDLYWKALNMALGATGTGGDRKGGLGLWGGRWFLLPDGVSNDAFGPAAMRAAQSETNYPVNPDNSRATLSRAFPVAVGSGLYEFHTPDGKVVKGSQGGNWRVRIRPQ